MNQLVKALLIFVGVGIIIVAVNFAVPAIPAMAADINPEQDYDVIHTLTFNEGSGTCNIRLYRGSVSTYSGKVYYRSGTSGAWMELSVSGTATTFPVGATTMQVAHDHNKSGNDYMTASFYGQSTNLIGIALSQKTAYSGVIGSYFMYYYAYGCSSLTSLGVPDTSGLTSAGNSFMYYYAYGCSSLTSLGVPDTSRLTSAGSSFMRAYAYGCSSLASLGVPDTSGLTSAGSDFMTTYAYGCSSLTSLAIPNTGSLISVGSYFTYRYARLCANLLRLELPVVGWFADNNVDWNVPSGRLGYLKGYVKTSNDLNAWQALVVNDKTLYTNYIRSAGDVILEANTAPNAPGSLGPAGYIDGSWRTNSTPALQFTQADDNEGDTVKYRIQIDDSADFGSAVVDYTSALMAPGATSFTVGQAAGSGSYTTGSQGQTLSDGISYYWRVMSTDNGGLESFWATANSGAIAFKIDASAPATPSITDDGDYTTSASQLHAAWISADDHSGIADNQYCISTDSNDCATGTIVDWTSTGATQEVAKTELTLSDGTTYYFHVKTQNNAGTWSSVGHSDGIMVDASAPANVSIGSIIVDSSVQLTIIASEIIDSGAGVHATPYWFIQTSGNDGGSSSTEWQASAVFVDDGLSPNTQYIYKVKARDALENESAYSSEVSKYTLANVPASLVAAADSQTQITISWEANGNPNGTEYYAEIEGAGANSGWIADTQHSFAGLACATAYSFRVKAKNGDGDETEWATAATTAQACPQTAVGGQFRQVLQTVSEHIPENKLPELPRIPRIAIDLGQAAQNIIRPIQDAAQNFIESFFPKKETPAAKDSEPVLPQTPPVFRGAWSLMPQGASNFALSPLPKELTALKNNFPQINNLFNQTGISRAVDLPRMAGVELSLPGISEIVGGKKGGVGLLISGLSAFDKQKIPEEQIFVRGLGNLDLNVKVKLDERGQFQQMIRTVTRHPVSLTVKVEKPAQKVYGYLIANGAAAARQQNIFARASLLLASLVGAQDASPSEMFLEKFDYIDEDGDNIYEAQIYAPAVKGNYQIRTIIEYEDNQEERQMNMNLVVDPEGYVYKMLFGEQVRVKNAKVSLYQLDPQTNEYQLWPARDFAQQNPQTTDITGQYAFLAPPGTYYLQADAPGYRQYKGETFVLAANQPAHENIELTPLKTAWYDFDWKFWILAILLGTILFALLIIIYRNNNNNNNKNQAI